MKLNACRCWGPYQRCARSVDGRSLGSAVPINYLNAPLVNGETRLHNTTSRYVLFEQRQPVCHSAIATRRGPKRLFNVFHTRIHIHARSYARIHVHIERYQLIKQTPKRAAETPSSYGQQPKAESCRRLMRTPNTQHPAVWRCQLLVPGPAGANNRYVCHVQNMALFSVSIWFGWHIREDRNANVHWAMLQGRVKIISKLELIAKNPKFNLKEGDI